MLKMYFALFLQEQEALRRVMIQHFSGVCEFTVNLRVISHPVLHLPSVHLSPATASSPPVKMFTQGPIVTHLHMNVTQKLQVPSCYSLQQWFLAPKSDCSPIFALWKPTAQSEFIFLLVTCSPKDESDHRVISIPEGHLQCHMMDTCLGRTDITGIQRSWLTAWNSLPHYRIP